MSHHPHRVFIERDELCGIFFTINSLVAPAESIIKQYKRTRVGLLLMVARLYLVNKCPRCL